MELLLLGAVLVLVSSSVYGPPFWKAGRIYLYLRKRKERICPETQRPVSVQVDAIHAARTMLTSGVADLEVSDCTRWPSRRGCNKSCLSILPADSTRETRAGNSVPVHQQSI
jgi:hypothetical protein